MTLYAQNQVVQSLRLAALTTSPAAERPTREAVDQFASALDSTVEELSGACHAARLEFDAASLEEALEDKSERKLTIVANDFGGTPVISVKTPETFEVVMSGDLPSLIDNVRTKFEELARGKADQDEYRFSADDKELLDGALLELASVGWDLYVNLFRDSGETGEALQADEENIQVAQLVLDKPIPWPAIYDAPYLANQLTDGGDPPRPVTHMVCPAGFPGPDGSLDAAPCRSRPDCVWHKDQIAKREREGGPLVRKETVVCPRRFWGFRHLIEMPLQQVVRKKPPRPPSTSVGCTRPATMLAGFHVGLATAEAHRAAMQTVLLPRFQGDQAR